MDLRAVNDALGGGDDTDRIFFREAFHDLFGTAFFQEGETSGVFRAEEDIHIGKDLLNAFPGLFPGPQIPPEVYVKGDQGARLLEPPYHFHSCFAALAPEAECDPACVETAGG